MNGAPDILARIAAGRRAQVEAGKARLPLPEMRRRAAARPLQGGFARAVTRVSAVAPPRVIAELKPASPSSGRLREPFDPRALAAELAAAGAAALSVLTEPDHFQAGPENLDRARQGAPGTPLLRKDFLVDEWQIWESRLLGADAVLLIAALLPGGELARLLDAAGEAGLEALVEVADAGELSRAVAAGARIIGVNSRDLRDFSVDLTRAVALSRHLPGGAVRVAESGVKGSADLLRLAAAGYDAVLAGTVLMRAPSPGDMLARWLRELAAGTGAA